jgi:hypothetical protein
MNKTKVLILVIALMGIFLVTGCLDRGDFKISTVIEGTAAPYDGWNLSPELYIKADEKVEHTGWIMYIKGLELTDAEKIVDE